MGQLHIFFFPMLAHGHMIPMLDMAKVFASHGVKATIITTPLNAPVFSNGIERAKLSGIEIGLHLIKFPSVESGVPEGCENLDQVMALKLNIDFFTAASFLQPDLEDLLSEVRPNCLVADVFFPWATEAAAKFNIPRLVFHGISSFALCASVSMNLYRPFENVVSDSDPFVLPDFPHQLKMVRSQVSLMERLEGVSTYTDLLRKGRESELSSYGVIVNSFFELEPECANHYKNVFKRKAWSIGPLSLCNRAMEDKADRGYKSAIDEHECLKWLNSKKPHSVVYICFGSTVVVTDSQLHEIAKGLDASEQNFIMVVKEGGNEKWVPEGFEERVKDRGLIIRGWAPQVLILDHEAVGGFVTHCGWNSALEGVCAGLPMVTWPIFAEQFYNEMLVTEVLKTGVAIGVKEWTMAIADGVKSEAVESAVRRLMIGEEAEGMRNRAKELKKMAKLAVEEDGSSYCDLNALIQELTSPLL